MLARAVAVVACAATGVLTVGVPAAWADGPTVTGYTPANARPGTVIDITGSGLAATTAVTFPGVSTAVTPASVTDTDVTVTVPVGALSGPLTLDPATAATPPDLGIEATSISAGAAAVVYSKSTSVHATLTAAGHGVPGQSAKLQIWPAGAGAWTTASGSKTTDANGAITFVVTPKRNTSYRVLFVGSPVIAAVNTAIVRVGVHPTVTVSFPAVAPVLTAQRIPGVVRPAIAGSIALQRLVSGAWKTAAYATPDSYGRFAFVLSKGWGTKGLYTYRAIRGGNSVYLASSTSKHTIQVVDRTLRSGMTGPDVDYLQRRLQSLHYDTRPNTKHLFDYDTQHAVIAFEKVQGMPRDGVVGPAVWTRLGRPTAPHLLHPIRGSVYAVEVDLTKQTLYLSYNAVIVRILDVSTGGGYTYTGSDGSPSRAITPTGHTHIYYKITGWHTSKLGQLYDPAYFNTSGFAIHGEGAVPVYPASHGCVRVTVPAMTRLYPLLRAGSSGTSVWIYRT